MGVVEGFEEAVENAVEEESGLVLQGNECILTHLYIIYVGRGRLPYNTNLF